MSSLFRKSLASRTGDYLVNHDEDEDFAVASAVPAATTTASSATATAVPTAAASVQEDERTPLMPSFAELSGSTLLPRRSRGRCFCCCGGAAAFWAVAALTAAYCAAELGAAVWLRSLVLLADGLRKLSDVLSVLLAWWALRAGRKHATFAMSFGWARTETVGSLADAVFLLGVCLYVALGAVQAFVVAAPPAAGCATQLGGLVFVGVAAVGLLVNLVGTLAFSRPSAGGRRARVGVNAKAVFLHYLGDSVASLFVLVAGVLLFVFAKEPDTGSGSSGVNGFGKLLPYFDPAASVLMVCFILATTLPLATECMVAVLLQSAPRHLDGARLQRDISEAQGVVNAHALHVWEFAEGVNVGSVHVKHVQGDDPAPIVRRVLGIMRRHGIRYCTVMPEPCVARPLSASPAGLDAL